MMNQCIFIFLSVFLVGILGSRIIKGPYEATVVYFRSCDETELKELTSPHKGYGSFIEMWSQIYNCSEKKCIRANVTIKKPVYNAKVKLREFSWRTTSNSWKLTQRVPELGCHTYIVKLAARFMNIKFDDRTCFLPKSSLAINNIDYDLVYHAWQMEAEYGRVKWFYELLSNGKTVFCLAAEYILSAKK